MKIKVGDLRKIIREVAEDAAAEETAALSAAIDDLAATWNSWSGRRRAADDADVEVMGAAAKHISAVRVLRKDQGTDKWGPEKAAAAKNDDDAAAWIADADALPWPSSDLTVKVAILKFWATDYRGERRSYPGDVAFLAEAGIAPPEPTVGVKSSMADIQIPGGEWMRLVLGVKSGDIMGALMKIHSADAARRAPKRRGRR